MSRAGRTAAEVAEARRVKVREMMFRRPACKELRWDGIRDRLEEIYDEVCIAQWMAGHDYDRLCEALDFDDEQLYELRIAFADLAGQCNQMREDMDRLREMDREVFYGVEDPEWDDPPALFDLFFPAIDAPGVVWGYDVTEHDYYGFDSAWDEDVARERARRRLERLTKTQLIRLAGLCLEIARQYMSLTARYDALTSALGILEGREDARLKVVERLEALYEATAEETNDFERGGWGKHERAFDAALGELPDRIWVE